MTAERLHPARGERFAVVFGGHARGSDRERQGDTRYGSPGRDGGRTLTRVGFLGSGLVAAAGALGGYAAQANAAESVQVWGLDPLSSGNPGPCGCAACASCRAHAANKLFANAAAADAGRAHPYCKCLVVPLARLEPEAYKSLFVNGGGRDSVDRRYQWVQAVFAHEAPARQSISQPAESSMRVMPAAPAALGRVRIRRAANGGRVLYADIETAPDVTVTLAITHHGFTIARRVVAGVSGRRRLRLPIPGSAKAGPARLRLRTLDSAGTSTRVSRGIQIPPA